MITLGDIKDCGTCEDPTKKRVGTSFDCGGPGSIEPVYDCKNRACKRKNNIQMSYLYRAIMNEKQEGGGGHD
jgi:hypothetical protein